MRFLAYAAGRFPVTCYFLDTLREIQRQQEGLKVVELVALALKATGQSEPYEQEMIQGVVDDLNAMSTPQEEGDLQDAKKDPEIGKTHYRWIKDLSTEQMLLWVTGGDFERALNIYKTAPVEVVNEIYAQMFRREMNEFSVSFEGTLIGMGGKFKKQESGSTVEQPKGNAQKLRRTQMLKQLGF